MKVLIAGGGIGGLTAALCCLHHGHDVMVFEQSAEIGEVGAGIQVSPNAMKVFEALGIADDIAANAFEPKAIETRMGESGLTIFNIPLADYAQRKWGGPYLHIHRADYIAALADALSKIAPESLKLDRRILAYRQDEASVSVQFDDGIEETGDALIGADGIHSKIREQMLGEDKPRFTGNVAWRAVVPVSALGFDAPNPTACAWMGRGKHAVTYLLRRGELANFVGVVEREDWQEEGWQQRGSKEDLQKDFSGWHPVIRKLIENVEEDSLFRWALFDRAPLPRWTDDRVVLLGDAAHPMLPFLAQGAAMAVEDAWVLASVLPIDGKSVSGALRSYETTRLTRASKVQAASRANMGIFHRRTLAGRLGTYGPMWLGARFAPGAVNARMSWLYGYDVVNGSQADF
ncbi:MAG: FAD-dependent monooxygenase [Pseudomonadota bacterium]